MMVHLLSICLAETSDSFYEQHDNLQESHSIPANSDTSPAVLAKHVSEHNTFPRTMHSRAMNTQKSVNESRTFSRHGAIRRMSRTVSRDKSDSSHRICSLNGGVSHDGFEGNIGSSFHSRPLIYCFCVDSFCLLWYGLCFCQ